MKRSNALRLVDTDYSTVVDIKSVNSHSNELVQLARMELKDSKREKQKYLEQWARATGETTTNINLYLEKKYPKNILAFEKKFRDVVEQIRRLSDLSEQDLRFCNDTINAKIETIGLEGTKEKGSISVFLGKPGIGKTSTAKYFSRNHNAAYVSLNRTDFTMHSLLSKMLSVLRIKSYTKVHNTMLNDIIDYLIDGPMKLDKDTDQFYYPPKLIIVDQSNYLSLDAIDCLRTVNEESGVGLCFLGLPDFAKKLNSSRPEIKQLKDRVSLMCELEDPTFEDISKVLDLNWPGLTEELKKEFFKYSRKTFRLLSHLINHCREDIYSEDNLGTELTVDHIRAAASYLPKASDDEE